MPLLFVDMLGVKARWVKGGRAAAEDAFQKFWRLIAFALRDEDSDSVTLGLLESDSAAIDCKTIAVALRIAKKLYHAAFIQTHQDDQKRLWLRGVILNRTSDGPLRTPSTFKADLGVDLMIYSGDLLDAITIEKCGFKGMRILIDQNLITQALRDSYKNDNGELFFVPFAKLRHSQYPNRVSEGYSDFLWMATVDEEEKKKLDMIMALRLRHASKDSEESLQAAATQVVFHEVTAMLIKLRGRAKSMKEENEANKALEPMPMSVTDAATQPPRQP